jgi:hypothetical protein
VKSRGTGHESDVQKLILSDDGIFLVQMDTPKGPKQKKRWDKNISENRKMSEEIQGE